MAVGSAGLRKIYEDIRASYWVVPATFVVVAILLGYGLAWLDRHPDIAPLPLPEHWIDRQGDGARTVLSTIASTIIGVAGVMFSMTLVAVSFAAGNFGPRLIGNFMRDRGTQVSFGLLLGTFTYTMFILRNMRGAVDGVAPFVPQYSLLGAMALMLISIFTMIYYVHHVPETINVSNIASDLGHRFSRDIRGLIDGRDEIDTETPASADRPVRTDIHIDAPGYIQQIATETLFTLARKRDWIIDVHHLPGTFLSPHLPVMTVHSGERIDPEDYKKLDGAIATGNSRTEDQATPFIGDQLCEMVARALSPGFNDPFTAISCMNWLHAGLMEALFYKGGLEPCETRRVRMHFTDFGDLLKPFENCAPYTVTDRMARLRHLDLTRALIDCAGEDHPQARRLHRLTEALDRPTQEIDLEPEASKEA